MSFELRRRRAVKWVTAAFGAVCATAFISSESFADCDHDGDTRTTVRDVLPVLQAALAVQCRESYQCDDLDYDRLTTVSDALLLLRFVVGLETEADCSCIAYDECFDDDHCQQNGYPAHWYCGDYVCYECESDEQCDPGFVCNRCQFACEAAP